jgi:hypothetical protein
MKKREKLQLNRETLRSLSLDNLATVHGGTVGSVGCGSFGCSYGCGGTNNCSTDSAGCNEN